VSHCSTVTLGNGTQQTNLHLHNLHFTHPLMELSPNENEIGQKNKIQKFNCTMQSYHGPPAMCSLQSYYYILLHIIMSKILLLYII